MPRDAVHCPDVHKTKDKETRHHELKATGKKPLPNRSCKSHADIKMCLIIIELADNRELLDLKFRER